MIENQEKEKAVVDIKKPAPVNVYQDKNQIEEYYNSNAELSEIKDEVKAFEFSTEKKIDFTRLITEAICFLGKFVVSFIQFVLCTLIVIPVLIIELSNRLRSCIFFDLDLYLWVLVSISTFIYAFVNYFFITIDNLYVDRLYLDGIFFILSTFLVFSYIKAFQQIKFGDIIKCMYNFLYIKGKPMNYKQDIVEIEEPYEDDDDDNNNINININIHINVDKEVKEDPKSDKLSAEYFRFSNQGSKKIKESKILREFKKFDIEEGFSFSQFIVLVIIIFLKLSGIFYYIYVHSGKLTYIDIIDMILIIFVFMSSSFNLLRTFGSYDLKRKEQQMRYYKFLIDFHNDDDLKNNYCHKLDITNPESLEVFDSSRQFILNFQKDFLERLDYAYVGLIFYYLFVIIVCASYYFELEWLIHKQSRLLEPMWVIMSTGNFFFLSAFLMFRFKEGTDFNNSFNELEIAVDHLLDFTDDLQTMYNAFFIQLDQDANKNKVVEENEIQEDFSPYKLLVKKIKVMSNYYIVNKKVYSGRYYKEHENTLLRQKILLNMRQALKKVKKSIQTDYKEHKYLFMGFVEVDVNSFLFTLLLGIVTSLPSIIPKFISFYHQQ